MEYHSPTAQYPFPPAALPNMSGPEMHLQPSGQPIPRVPTLPPIVAPDAAEHGMAKLEEMRECIEAIGVDGAKFFEKGW